VRLDASFQQERALIQTANRYSARSSTLEATGFVGWQLAGTRSDHASKRELRDFTVPQRIRA